MSAVENLFIIRSKRYVCEKLTATFNSQGMSQLIKGSFLSLIHILDIENLLKTSGLTARIEK